MVSLSCYLFLFSKINQSFLLSQWDLNLVKKNFVHFKIIKNNPSIFFSPLIVIGAHFYTCISDLFWIFSGALCEVWIQFYLFSYWLFSCPKFMKCPYFPQWFDILLTQNFHMHLGLFLGFLLCFTGVSIYVPVSHFLNQDLIGYFNVS